MTLLSCMKISKHLWIVIMTKTNHFWHNKQTTNLAKAISEFCSRTFLQSPFYVSLNHLQSTLRCCKCLCFSLNRCVRCCRCRCLWRCCRRCRCVSFCCCSRYCYQCCWCCLPLRLLKLCLLPPMYLLLWLSCLDDLAIKVAAVVVVVVHDDGVISVAHGHRDIDKLTGCWHRSISGPN